MMVRAAQIAICAILLAVLGALVHPFGPVRQPSSVPLFKGAEIDQASLQVFERACANCHSERVQWPWYSHVAPLSWVISAMCIRPVRNSMPRAGLCMNHRHR